MRFRQEGVRESIEEDQIVELGTFTCFDMLIFDHHSPPSLVVHASNLNLENLKRHPVSLGSRTRETMPSSQNKAEVSSISSEPKRKCFGVASQCSAFCHSEDPLPRVVSRSPHIAQIDRRTTLFPHA